VALDWEEKSIAGVLSFAPDFHFIQMRIMLGCPAFFGLAGSSGSRIIILVNWTVYIIRCNDDSLYTGVTTDLARRFKEHFEHRRGAKFFNGRSPREVVYVETGHTRSTASRRESAIKKLTREEKLRLIAGAG